MQATPVGLEVTPMALLGPNHAKQFAFELAVSHLHRQRPAQARSLEAFKRVANRRRRHTNTTRNLPGSYAANQLQSKDFAHLAHARSLRRHLPPSFAVARSRDLSRPAEAPPGATPGKIIPEWWAKSFRNGGRNYL